MQSFRLAIAALLGTMACGQADREPPTLFPGGAGGQNVGGQNVGGQNGSSGNGAASASGSAGAPVSEAGGAGLGGNAGATSPGVDECTSYCQASDYRLPAALCEDWNQPGWEPEFCGLGSDLGCDKYCEAVFSGVSPECAAALPRAISCVGNLAALGMLQGGQCPLENCRDRLYEMTSACYGLREKLAAARAHWDASGITDYQLRFTARGVDAQVEVRAGAEPVVHPADAKAWTVPALFDEVDRLLHTPSTAPSVTFDPDRGYVIDLGQYYGCGVVGLLDAVEVVAIP